VASLKKLIAACAAASMLMASGMNTAALASTHDKTYATQILLNGKAAAIPYILVHGSTKYVPISAVEQVLKSQGIRSSWNGHSWRLTTPSRIQPDLSNIHAGAGSTTIYVNGKLVLRTNSVVSKDPASKHTTAYVPLGTVEQLLKRLQFDSTWDGTRWNLFSRDFELKVLADAGKTLHDAAYRQYAGTMTINVTLNLTEQGKEDLKGVQFPWTVQEQIDEKDGVVAGEPAFTETEKVIKDPFDDVPPPPKYKYGQGSHVYENDGNGWTELPNDGQIQQPDNTGLIDEGVTDVKPKAVKNGFQYSLGFKSEKILEIIDNSLSNLGVDVNKLDDAERQSLLRNTSASMQVTVTPTNGTYYISDYTMRFVTTIPANLAFTGTDSDSEQLRNDADSVKVEVVFHTQITYDKVEITRPSDLPQN
jgi:hypothetical protein